MTCSFTDSKFPKMKSLFFVMLCFLWRIRLILLYVENKSQPSIHVSASVWMGALFFWPWQAVQRLMFFPPRVILSSMCSKLTVSTSPLVTGMQTLYADVNGRGWKEKSEGILWFTKICLNIYHFKKSSFISLLENFPQTEIPENFKRWEF